MTASAKPNEFSGKTAFITGGSRGIGLAIAKGLARSGANIALFAKTAEPHPKLPGTIYTAAAEIEALGGKVLPLVGDIRDEAALASAIKSSADEFGGIDICINNASALYQRGTSDVSAKKYDLMMDVNVRGTFLASKFSVPYLRRSTNPHVLTLSPPLSLDSKWLTPHVAYTLSKYGMSLCVLGMAGEFHSSGIAFNALWPRTIIDTAAIRNLPGGSELSLKARHPDIVADAALEILRRPSRQCTGKFFIDEDVLRDAGVQDLGSYAVISDGELQADIYVEESDGDHPVPVQ